MQQLKQHIQQVLQRLETCPHPCKSQDELIANLNELRQLLHAKDYDWLFFHRAKIPVLIIEPVSGRICNANPAALHFYGYDKKTLKRMTIYQINQMSDELLQQEIQHAAAEERTYFNFTHLLASGEIRNVEVHSGPIELENKQFLYSFIYDQTEQIQRETIIHNKNQQLQNVITGTRVGTWEWNFVTGEVRLNNYWAEMLGFTLNDFLPLQRPDWRRLIHPDDLTKFEQALEEHYCMRNEAFECEIRMQHKNGSWIWVLSRGQVLERDELNHPLIMAGTNLDITARKRAELLLKENEIRYRTLHDCLPVGCILQDLDHRIIAINEEACRILGTTKEAIHNLDCEHVPWQRIHENGIEFTLEEHPAILCMKTGQPQRDIVFGLKQKDRIQWLSVNSQPLIMDNQIQGAVSSFTDITEQKKITEYLSLAASVFTEAREAIVITEADGTIVNVNHAFSSMTGFTEQDVIGQTPRLWQSGYHDQSFYEQFWSQLSDIGHWSGEIWNRKKNGEIIVESQTISAVRNAQGNVHHYVCLASDITRQKTYEQQLKKQAYYDLLTGLPNRKLLADQLGLMMAQSQKDDFELAVAYIDLDGFKQINDEYGHQIGDQLLIRIAERMRLALRDEDMVARIGGDEFIALCLLSSDHPPVEQLIQRLLKAVARTVEIQGLKLRVSASIGITFYPHATDLPADELLKQADQAMYRAKQSGKNCYSIYEPMAANPNKMTQESMRPSS